MQDVAARTLEPPAEVKLDNPRLHIVFGLSPAGILRQALSSLGLREQVLDIMDDLSLGPIACGSLEGRAEWLTSELGTYHWLEVLRRDAELPARSSEGNRHVVAWYAPNRADSLAGFMWWLSQMGLTKISIMRVPDLSFKGVVAMMKLVGQQVPLADDERASLQSEWRALRSENALLRVFQNGRLQSASLDYFDNLILDFASCEWRPAMRVVGDAFSTISLDTGHFIDDEFTSSRLRALAGSGVIEWDGDLIDVRGSRVRRI